MKFTKLIKAAEFEKENVKEELQTILEKIKQEKDLYMSEVVYLQNHKEDIKKLFPDEPILWQWADNDEEEWNNKKSSNNHKIERLEDCWIVDNKYEIDDNGTVFYSWEYTGKKTDFPEWVFNLAKELVNKKSSKKKAYKYPRIEKDGDIYHVLDAEGTKSKQFDNKEDAEEFKKSISSKLNKKAGESYGWVVNPEDAWNKLELWKETVGAEAALDDLAKAMGTDELSSCLAFIFRNNDFKEGCSDYEEEVDE